MDEEVTTTTDDTPAPRNGALVRRTARDVVLMPVMDVRLAQRRLEELQEFCANYLQESRDGGTDGGDYGSIPGAGKKKVLFKSGSDKLCDVYGLADRYIIVSKVEDFDRGLFDYVVECHLVRKTDEMFVGSGLGSCSSWESSYRWRDTQRACPACGASAIIKGRAEFGGGWLCWTKKGGCGAKYADNEPAILDQTTGRSENPDIIDAKNTVLKIAKKRAKIDAVIGVTRSSGIFAQDLDEHELPPLVAEPSVPDERVKVSVDEFREIIAEANESHAERIARVKREHEQAAAKAEKPVKAPTIAVPMRPMAVPKPTAVSPALADGEVHITAINVRNGPMVMKDGKSAPSWGPLYIIAFSQKVEASDGTLVTDATTFKQEDAALAESARDAGTAVKPVVEPGTKKGSFKLVRFD